MTQWTMFVKIKAKASSEELMYGELLKLIQPTLSEAGCINYDLHRSIEKIVLLVITLSFLDLLITCNLDSSTCIIP